MRRETEFRMRRIDFGVSHAKESLRKFKKPLAVNLPIFIKPSPDPIKKDLKKFLLTGSVEDLKQSFPSLYIHLKAK